ncbi:MULTISPECIES: hypothetical protein [unclassified Leifsonia]|uniref:hypothetical protein n=1 Tax=unclassified Leifsonia TaxID=2663824 RepID=UPI0008A757A7|nr:MULTISPECIES: hypothetical protein [unclassified Leifsonia]SEH68367.1 Transcriptional regulator, AbiEi antitoxin, Type IV TA system [Leifsonia sp. CL154]SFL29822.1 Transcriptional regulator, AbiEi antitoxin, Type IV TA system [Leifsonia sp. CL147]
MTRDSSLPMLVLVRHLVGHDETRQQHARAARRGVEVRVGRGAYVERETWEALARAEKQWVRLSAYARTRARAPIFSHWSAAVLHGLPFADERTGDIHVAVGSTAGGRSARGVRAHSVQVPEEDIVQIDGMLCTDLARTVVDIAATSPMREAVAATDHVLRGASARSAEEYSEEVRRGLLAAWMRAQPLRGHRRALDVLSFADGRSESVLESVSRLAMYEAGLPKPELQRSFSDARGRIGYVDFAWPDFRIIGEADGDAKYLDAALRGGRTAERVVLEEKIREDRLRALGWTVVRWRWPAVQRPAELIAALSAAGLPADPRRRWDDCGAA